MNEENKKQVIMMVVLLVVAVGVIGYQFGPIIFPASSSSSSSSSTQAAAVPAPTKLKYVDINIDDLLTGIAAVDFDYGTDRILRDPMRPLIGQASRMGDAAAEDGAVGPAGVIEVMQKRVTGIMFDEIDPVAIVDNEIVTQGYTYPNGIVVQEIGRDGVTFKVGDNLIPVTMEEL